MVYDVHEQYRLASVMYYRKTRPPFTGQLDHDTELASLRQALIQLRSTIKQNPEAESSYVEALKRAPSDAFLVRRYGEFLLQNQRVTEAVNVYQRGIGGHPFDPSLRTGLAEALASGGARDKADPYNYIPQFSLGLQKLKLGQIRDGLKHVTESVNLKPDFVPGYETLVTAYTQFDKADTARQYRVLKALFSP